ncbi:MAG: transthyretin-like family protein [Thermoguttaceae bacterium]
MRTVTLCVSLGFLALVSGCTKPGRDLPATVDASGVVTLDGTPVEGASVMFIADSGTNHATGTTDDSGRFSLKAFPEKDGAVPGSYKVEVNKTVLSDQTDAGEGGEATVNIQFGLPQKYATFVTSGLTATIPEEGTSDLKIELTSK